MPLGRGRPKRTKLTEEQVAVVGKALLSYTSEEAVKLRLNTFQLASLDLIRKYFQKLVPANRKVGKRFIPGKHDRLVREIVRLWDAATERNRYWNE